MPQAHYDDKAIGSTYDNPGVGRGAKGKRGSNRQENQRGAYRQDSQRGGYRQNVQRGKNEYAPKGYGNVGCYDEEKYLNDGKPLNFKNKKKKSFNPNFDSNNRNKRGKK